MIKYPNRQKKEAAKATEAPATKPGEQPKQPKAEPFTYNTKPDTDAQVDQFLAAKGPDFQARIDATPKDYFVRKWALGLARQDEKVNQYYAAVERTLNQPEHAKLKEALHGKYEQRNIGEEVKNKLVLKEAGQRFKTDGVELSKAPTNGKAVPPPVPRIKP